MFRNAIKIDLKILIIFFYTLFIWRTWKMVNAPIVDGILSTNEIYFVVAYIILGFLYAIFFNRNMYLAKDHPGIVYLLFFVYIIFTNCLIKTPDEQNTYAIIVMLASMATSIVPQVKSKRSFSVILCMIASISVLYAILGIYTFITREQTRMDLPVGVATTVVYFFIVAIPLVNLACKLSTNVALKAFFQIGFWLVVVATFLTVSRAGIAIACLLVAWCIFDNSEKTNRNKKMFRIALVIIGLLFILSLLPQISAYVDLSRLYMGFNDSSTSEREKAALLGLEIFKHNPIIGAGNGTYFTRVYTFSTWTDKLISAYGVKGLLDPHNGFVLLLSENGIIGFGLVIWFYISIYKRINQIKNSLIKTSGKQIMLSIMIYSFASSDMYTVVGLSTCIWIILGMYISYSYSNYNKEEICYE